MADIGKLWAGHVFGTNTGNLFVELVTTGDRITGILRFLDSQFGLAVYDVEGQYDGAYLQIRGKPKQSQPGVVLGDLEAKIALTPTGTLRGQWTSSIGTGGTLELFPHVSPDASATAARSEVPVLEQLYTQRVNVGAVRLYAPDLASLVEVVKRDFAGGQRVVVTYRKDNTETSRYVEDFESDRATLGKLEYVRVGISAPEAYGLNKTTTVELNAQGVNQITVQGIHEAWVIGKAEAVARQLRAYEKSVVTNVRKWGLTVTQLGLLAMLLFAPEEFHTLWRRTIFAAVVLGLLACIVVLHRRYVPTAVIYMSPKQPGIIEKIWPSVLSWLIAVSAGVAAAFAFYWLRGAPPP